MKKYNKYIKTACFAVMSAFLVSSCTENQMDDVNKDDSNPLDVQAKFIVTELLTSTAFSTTGGDFSLYSSIYIEHEGGTFNQTYNAENRIGEPTSAATYNNAWEGTYTNIKLAKLVIKKCTEEEGEKGNDITLGIAKVLLAYNAAVLTDLFGDIPYTESGVIDEHGLPVYRQPKVDKQEDVYKDIFTQLDEAIVLFDGEDAGLFGAVGKNDYYYNGNGADWKRAAYGLKARYTMRLLNKSSDKTASLKNILSYIDKSFTSASTELKFNLYDGAAQTNPLAAFTYSRYGLGASKSLVQKLSERKDPRLTQIFIPSAGRAAVPVTDPSKLVLVPNGQVTEESQTTYSRLITDVSSAAPTILLSYHELLFLKAEAYARLSDKVNAEKYLKEAIEAGFTNLSNSVKIAYEKGDIRELPVGFDLSKAVSDKYYTESVKVLFDANPLKEVMNQKYLSTFGANGESIEAYNDYRRLLGADENLIKLDNPKNAEKEFPLRFVYGNSDVVANPNITSLVGDGYYAYSEKVWWAGGTR